MSRSSAKGRAGARAGLVRAVAALAAGATTTAAFPPVSLWWLAVVGVAGLMLVARGRSAWGGAGLGLLFGLGLFTPLLHFTAIAMGNPSGWIVLTVFQSLYLALLGGAWAVVSRLSWLGSGRLASSRRVLSFAVLWGGVEELRSTFPLGGFPFGRLAYVAADAPMLAVAGYLGSLGLSLAVALIAAAVAELVEALRARRLAVAATSALTALGVGLAPLLLPLEEGAQAGTVRVAAVQGNVAEDFEDAFNRALEVTGNHVEATQALAGEVGAGGVDLVLWPENSADIDPRDHAQTAALVEQAAQAVGAPVLVGAVRYGKDEASGAKVRYNDLLLWQAGQGAGGYYRKHLPVPFAEYVPWRAQVRRITTQVDRIGTDLLPGQGPYTLEVPAASLGREVRLAVGICFEVAYDSALRAGVEQGGELIVVPTNNASFLHSSEAAQQLDQGRVQAVVHGRAVVQASTVGITAIISPSGVVEQATVPYTQAALVAQVPLRTSLTWADRLGPWLGWVVQVAAAALVVAGSVGAVRDAVARRRGRRR